MYRAVVIEVKRRSGRGWWPKPVRIPAQVLSVVEILDGEHDGFAIVDCIPIAQQHHGSRHAMVLLEDIREGATPLAAQAAARDWDTAKRESVTL